jgi:hypothetical protein
MNFQNTSEQNSRSLSQQQAQVIFREKCKCIEDAVKVFQDEGK